jgi:anti-anti-sigma factor
MSLEIKIEDRPKGVYAVMLIGRLDAETYISFQEKISPLISKSTKVIVLNMDKLVYISSIGLNEIFNAKKTIVKLGGSLVIANLQPQIKKVFEVMKILPKDIIFEDMERVDEYLDAIQRRETKKNPPAK